MKTIAEESIRINKIANGSDDAIDLFKNTPIYENLLTRRLVARNLDKQLLDNEKIELFRLIEKKILEFLSIY